MNYMRQHWRHWQSPVEGVGKPGWLLQPDTEVVKVCRVGRDKIGVLTSFGQLFVGQFDSDGSGNNIT